MTSYCRELDAILEANRFNVEFAFAVRSDEHSDSPRKPDGEFD
jgi:hypothetical protein